MTTSVMANTVYLGEATPNDQQAPEAPKAPNVTLAVSGSQTSRFERVIVTAVNGYGESAPSPEVVIQVPANNVIVVTNAPETKFTGDYPSKPYFFNVYATTGASLTETKQNTANIPTGQTWQEPATGLISGAALPTAVAPIPGFTANSNLSNAAPPTGNITVAQSPLNTPTPNTGRTTEATQAYMAASLNALNVGTTPPPTGNLPH